MIKEAEKKK